MQRRSGGRGEKIREPQALLDMLGNARGSLIKTSSEVRPYGVSFHAIHMVTAAIDTLAYFVTGQRDYYSIDGALPSPGRKSWNNDRQTVAPADTAPDPEG